MGSIAGKRVLTTGGAGFLGSHLCDRLVERGHEVICIDNCVTGSTANVEHLRELAESSPSIVTPLNSVIGYDEAAAVAKQALKEHKTIRQTVIDRGLIGDKLSIEELDRRLDVLAMAKVKDGD